jgi:O-antigen/teichoic acid export membrane protein
MVGRVDDIVEVGLARRVGAAMAWGQIGKVVELVLTTAIAIVAVRALSPAGFGTYSLLTNFVGVASVLIPVVTTEALGAVLPRMTDAQRRLYIVLLIALARLAVVVTVSLVAIALWDTFRDDFGLSHVEVKVVAAAAGYWAVQDVLNSIAGLYTSTLHVRAVTLWRAVGQLATLLALGALVLVRGVSVGATIAVVAGGYLIAVAALVAGLSSVGRPRRPERDEVRFALGFTRNVWIIGVVSLAIGPHIYSLLIGAITKDTAEVAFYVAAVGVIGRAQILLLSGWSSLIIPTFGAVLRRDGAVGLARAWNLFTKFWLVVAAPASALMLVLAEPIIHVLFGNDYAPSVRFLQVVSGFGLASAFLAGPPSIGVIWALDRQGLLVRVRLVTTPIAILLSLLLIRRYEALGAVIAGGTALSLTSLAELVIARRAVAFTYPLAFAAWAAAASAAIAAPALVLRPEGAAGAVVATALGVAAVVVAALIVRPFGSDDVGALRSVSPRLDNVWLRRLARS